jgi:hypothetical protein
MYLLCNFKYLKYWVGNQITKRMKARTLFEKVADHAPASGFQPPFSKRVFICFRGFFE